MGNQLSCVSSLSTAIAANAIRYSDTKPCITIVNVINGRACQVPEPLTAGELMLELQGQCVVEVDAHILERGSNVSGNVNSRRIVGLPADHSLRANHLYFTLPLQRIESRLSADELQVLIEAAERIVRNSASAHMHTSKITPLSTRHCAEAASINVVEASQGLTRIGGLLRGGHEDDISDDEEGVQAYRTIKKARSWTPKLDTIAESLPIQ